MDVFHILKAIIMTSKEKSSGYVNVKTVQHHWQIFNWNYMTGVRKFSTLVPLSQESDGVIFLRTTPRRYKNRISKSDVINWYDFGDDNSSFGG